MSLISKLLGRLRWLLRSSMLRQSLMLSVIFALGFAIAIFVALTLGEDANERRVDDSLSALAGTSVLDGSASDGPDLILRAQDDLRGLPMPFRRAVERGGGTVHLQNNLRGSDIWRVLVTKDGDGTPVVVAVSLEETEEAQALLAGILWTTAAVVVALTLGIGFITGTLAQKRLSRIDQSMTGKLPV